MAGFRTPLVSIITPAFNSERFIGEAMDSVSAQTRGDLEHLVVDDGSSDATRGIVRDRARGDARLRLLDNGLGKGPAGARNTGILAARGRYVAFLDSDDFWYPDKLAVQIDLLRSCDAPLVYGAFDLVREDGSATGNSRKVPAEVDYATLLRANVVGCLTAIFDRERAGTPLMPDIRMRQDWGLWLRILRETSGVARAVPESVAALRIRPGSLSSNKLKATWYSYVLLARIEEQGALRAARNIVAHNVWRLLAGRT